VNPGALFAAYHLDCKAILVLTESGATPLWMSRHESGVPVHALMTQEPSQRKMALYLNVCPLIVPRFEDRDTALDHAERILGERGELKPGDTCAITCGEPMGYPGGTNMLKICRVG
jgi:pyruvate kinase